MRFARCVLGFLALFSLAAAHAQKVKENLINRGMEIVGSTPEAFASFLKQESEASGRLIQSAGIKVE